VDVLVRAIAALSLVLALAGCRGPALIGRFTPEAFYHSGAHYRVRYASDHRVLPDDWRLANFERNEEGSPTVARNEPPYWTPPLSRPRLGMERFDLHFVNSALPAEIFVRSIPDPYEEAPVRTLLYAGSIDLPGRPYGRSVWVHHEGRAVIDGRSAYAMTFETAASPSAPAERITVVGLRTVRRTDRGSMSAILLFGYSSPPSSHDAVRETFEQLVSRVDLRRAN
jgi:hypothetical protein